MKIDSTTTANISSTQTEGLKKSEQANKTERLRNVDPGAKAPSSAVSSRAEISSRGKDSAKAHAMAGATPDVREDKIAELKKRIAAGEYKIDNDAIADKMISEHMSF